MTKRLLVNCKHNFWDWCALNILQSTKTVTVDQIKAVFPNEHKEITEETYDIYLLPPGEDPEACQSYLRMRNKDGKYTLMFEVWPINSLFICWAYHLLIVGLLVTFFVLSFSDGKFAWYWLSYLDPSYDLFDCDCIYSISEVARMLSACTAGHLLYAEWTTF